MPTRESGAPGGEPARAERFPIPTRDGASSAAPRAPVDERFPLPAGGAAPATPPSPAAERYPIPPRNGGGSERPARPAPSGQATAPATATATVTATAPATARATGPASDPSPAPAEPAAIPTDPALAWRVALEPLGPHGRVLVEENAAFGGFEGGTLVLLVRSEVWRARVRERLQEIDFVSVLPGFRRFDVRLGGDGRTGREARGEVAERRLELARAGVERSPLVRRLVAALGGAIETIEPSDLAEAPDGTDDANED